MKHFFTETLGLTTCGWLLSLALSLLVTTVVYVAIQIGLQRQMFEAVRSVDVLESFCDEDPALADSCMKRVGDAAGGSSRLSDPTIWHLLREAQLLDTEMVAWPGALQDAPDPVEAISAFLKAPERVGESGVELLIEAAEICGGGRPVGANGRDVDAIWTAMIVRLIAATGKEAAQVATGKMDVTKYLDKRPESNDLSADFRIRDAAPLRLAVPPRLADARLVSALVGYSGGFEDDPLRQGISITGDCTEPAADSSRDFDEEELYGAALGRIGLALWVAGQIRRDNAVATVAARAALFTGPEQFGIMAVFIFGVGLAGARLLCLRKNYRECRLTAGPAKDHAIDPVLKLVLTGPATQREYWRTLLIQRITSPRWPLPTAAVLLPALGFVGTVRGIKTSLARAEVLVFANTLNERADAIGALAGDLGHAFGTTLLALLGSLVLTILLAIEGRLVDMLLIRQMDVRRHHTSQSQAPG